MNVLSNWHIDADLHCHTTASDGTLSPTELVRLAKEIGLKAIGITDHDTIQGWNEAEEAGNRYGVEILKGIELNTDWQGVEVHILGYEIRSDNSSLRKQLSQLRQARRNRMLQILQQLEKIGIRIFPEDVEKFALGESIGRPHIAQTLVEKGYVSSIKEAFDRYIGYGAPAYVPRFKLTPEEGIHMIREAEGVAVLAHPGVHHLEASIPIFVKQGLQGVEVSHSEHTLEDEIRYRKVAPHYDLIMTGGSDFHGEARKPGVKLGGWGAPFWVVRQIKELAQG